MIVTDCGWFSAGNRSQIMKQAPSVPLGPADAFMSVIRAAVKPWAGGRAAGPGRAPAPGAREQPPTHR